jgi:hypothetical protein
MALIAGNGREEKVAQVTNKAVDSVSKVTARTVPQPAKQHAENDTVHIGYTSYSVWESWWSTKLSDNEFLNQQADANYLFYSFNSKK